MFVRHFHHVGTKVAAPRPEWYEILRRASYYAYTIPGNLFPRAGRTDNAIVNNFYFHRPSAASTTTTDRREFMPITTGAHLALPPWVVFINLTPSHSFTAVWIYISMRGGHCLFSVSHVYDIRIFTYIKRGIMRNLRRGLHHRHNYNCILYIGYITVHLGLGLGNRYYVLLYRV